MRLLRLTALGISALYLFLSAAVPLTHTCRCAPADAGPATVAVRAPELAGVPGAAPSGLCRLARGCRAVREAPAPESGQAHPAFGDAARPDGACLACAYLRSSQSGGLSGLAETVGAPAGSSPAAPTASGLSPLTVPANPPARAPPAAS